MAGPLRTYVRTLECLRAKARKIVQPEGCTSNEQPEDSIQKKFQKKFLSNWEDQPGEVNQDTLSSNEQSKVGMPEAEPSWTSWKTKALEAEPSWTPWQALATPWEMGYHGANLGPT